MGCRCNERRDVIRQGVAAARAGHLAGVRHAAGYVGRTLIEDARSGDLRRMAEARIAALRSKMLPGASR